jgi:hypothetical protein
MTDVRAIREPAGAYLWYLFSDSDHKLPPNPNLPATELDNVNAIVNKKQNVV